MRPADLFLIALAGLKVVEAGRNAEIEIGECVSAEVPTTVNLINKSGYNATRIVLSFYPPAWESKSKFGKTGNQCLLVKEMAIKPEANNSLSVTIPALVAPEGASCALEFTLYNGPVDPSQGIRGIRTNSKEFTLLDGEGSWSQNELTSDGYLMMSPQSLLCEAVDCVRRCQDASFPYQCKKNDMDCRHNSTAEDAEYECTRGCPGIQWPPVSVVQSTRAMHAVEMLTGGGAGTPTRSTCAPTTWKASSYRRESKDEL